MTPDMRDAHETARARDERGGESWNDFLARAYRWAPPSSASITYLTRTHAINPETGEFTPLDFHREWLHVMDTQHPHTPQENDMPNNQRRHREQMGVLDQIHDTLTEIRDRLPEREVACGDVRRYETERPCTRPSGHDGNHVDKVGTIWANPEPAPADVDLTEPSVNVTETPDLSTEDAGTSSEPADITEEPPVGSRFMDCHGHVWRRGERGWGIETIGSNFDNPWSTVQQYTPLTALDPAPADVDPDEDDEPDPLAEVIHLAVSEELGWEYVADVAREQIEQEQAAARYQQRLDATKVAWHDYNQRAEKAEADLARVTKERDRLTHLLGSHADGHRCTCEMTDPGKPGIEPPTWEQDPWCLTHPDMAVIVAEVKTLKVKADRYDALREDVESLREAWKVPSILSHAVPHLALDQALARDTERAES